MSLSFLAAAAATLAAAVGVGLLVRGLVRLPRIELVPWLVAAAGLTIALAAQALGYHSGFGATTFRAVQLGAQLLAPLALAWGVVELTARGVGGRFAGRLLLAAVAVIAGVILATDPLSSTPFSRAWPPASAHYQIIPNGVLLLVAAITVLVALVAVTVAGIRSGRDPAGRAALAGAAAGAGGVLVIQLLRMSLPLNAAYAAVCLVTAALAWFGGTRAEGGGLPAAAGQGAGRGRYEDDEYGGLYRQDDTGYRGYRDDTGYGEAAPDTGYGPAGADTGWGTYGGKDISDTGYGFYRDDTGGLRAVSDTGYGLYRDDTGSMVFADGTGAIAALPGGDTGFGLPVLAGPGGGEESTDQLYGQIAIYTLLEDQAGEFDELAQDVVAKVKAREPETLVYVMHGVPSAPMQRILYEVYRDQAAYEQHSGQPYVREFEERRKPYVLATNVIELGVRQAKVSPLAPESPAPGPAQPAPPAAAPAQPARPRSRAAPDPGGPPPAPDPSWTRNGSEPSGSRSRPEPSSWPREAPRSVPSRPEPSSWPREDPLAPASEPEPLSWPGNPQPAASRPEPSWDGRPEPSWDGEAPEPPQPRGGGPSRGRRASGHSRDDTGPEPPRSRRSGEQPRSRRAPEPPPPDEGDFWTRPPADPPDEGDFWSRGSGHR